MRKFSLHFGRFPRPRRSSSRVSASASAQFPLCFAVDRDESLVAAESEGWVLRIKCPLHLTLLGFVLFALSALSHNQIRRASPTASFVLIAPGEMRHTRARAGPYQTLDGHGAVRSPSPREDYTLARLSITSAAAAGCRSHADERGVQVQGEICWRP